MKLCVAFSLLTSAAAFVVPQKGAFVGKATQLAIGRDSNVDLGGNTWSPGEHYLFFVMFILEENLAVYQVLFWKTDLYISFSKMRER